MAARSIFTAFSRYSYTLIHGIFVCIWVFNTIPTCYFCVFIWKCIDLSFLIVCFYRNLRKERKLLRPFSSEAAKPQIMYEQEPSADQESVDDLKSRIFRVRLPKRSVTNVLQNWVSEGREIGISELRKITKELRQSQRFKHALEVVSWLWILVKIVSFCVFSWIRLAVLKSLCL